MKFLKKLKSSNFWVSMISAVVLILQAVFNVEIKTEYLNQIIMAILGLLVMSGIVSDGSNDEVTVNQDVNIDSVKENVTNILTQVASAFETNLSCLIKQFEVIKDNCTTATSKSKVEDKLDVSTTVETTNNENIDLVENQNSDKIVNNANNQTTSVAETVDINNIITRQKSDDENVL